jgi:protein TonB
MTRVSPLFRFMPYGAPELLDAGRPNLARALVTASSASVLVFALFGALRLVHPSVITIPRMPVVDIVFAPPHDAPTITDFQNPSASPPVTHPSAGSTIDQVVPDAQVKPGEPSFAPPDISGIGDPTSDVQSGEVVLDGRAPAETLPARGAFVNVEVMPEVLRQVEPVYPTIAKDTGISGFVLVHMLVGRNGRVVNAVVDEDQSDAMFNDAALAAARQFVFRPASNNGRTVAVWVTQGFRFTHNH